MFVPARLPPVGTVVEPRARRAEADVIMRHENFTEDERARQVAAWNGSGLTQVADAKEHGRRRTLQNAAADAGTLSPGAGAFRKSMGS